jgi:hypothetical protein
MIFTLRGRPRTIKIKANGSLIMIVTRRILNGRNMNGIKNRSDSSATGTITTMMNLKRSLNSILNP